MRAWSTSPRSTAWRRTSRSGSCWTSSAHYQPELLERPRLVVGTKADIGRSSRRSVGRACACLGGHRRGRARARRARWRRWSHEARSDAAGARGHRDPPARARRARSSNASASTSSGSSAAQVERVVALNDVTTPEALSYIDYRLEAARRAQAAGPRRRQDGDVVWIGEFSFEYQPDAVSVAAGSSPRSARRRSPTSAGVIDDAAIVELCDAGGRAARAPGHEVVARRRRARSSAGVAALGLPARPTDMRDAAGAGRGRAEPADGARTTGRSTPTAWSPPRCCSCRNDFVDRRQYLHARRHAGAAARARLRADHQRERRDRQPTRSATATTTASPRSSRTTSTPTLLVLLTDTPGPVHRRPARRPDGRS